MNRPSPQISTSTFKQWKISPLPGLICTLVATGLAIAFVPDDVQPANALRLSSAIMAIGLLIIPVVQTIAMAGSAVHPLHILAGAPVYWLLLDQLQAAFEMRGIQQKDVIFGYELIGLFSSGVWLAATHRAWKIPKMVSDSASVRLSGDNLFTVAGIAFFLSFIRFAIPANFDLGLMLQAFRGSRWDLPWGRGMLGGWDSFLDHLSYFAYVLPCLAVLIGRSDGWTNFRTVMTIVFAMIMMGLMSTLGSRRLVGVMMGSGFVAWFLTANPPKLKHIIVVSIACGLLLAFLQVMLTYRNIGFFGVTDDYVKMDSRAPKHLHVDDNFFRMSQIVSIFPDKHPHLSWKWLVYIAVRPIPRVLWPGKPLNAGFDLASYNGQRNVALTCSLVGETYMSFGVIGCFVGGWIMGRLAMSLAAVAEQNSGPGAMVIFGTGLLAMFAGMRSAIEVVLMSYAIVAWILLIWVYRHFTVGREG